MHATVTSQIALEIQDLSDAQLIRIMKECTVKNKEYDDTLSMNGWVSADIPEFYQLYEVVDDYMYLPKGFIDTLRRILPNLEVEWKTNLFEPCGFQFKELMEDRAYQTKAVDEMLQHYTGILVAPTGSGKTNMGVSIIEKLQQPTLILVHRYHLIDQWKERIETLLGYKVGIIAGSKWKVKNITLAMIPTLHADPRRVERIQDRFGLVLIDECHHTPAYTWLANILRINSTYLYGCSATPTRKDQLQKMMYLGVGNIRHIVSDTEVAANKSIVNPVVKVKRTGFVGFPAFTRVDFSKVIPHVVIDQKRNKLIADTIISEPHNYHLVLSDRIAHLGLIKEMVDQAGIRTALVVGSVSQNDRKEIFSKVSDGEIHVIFATSVADEGLDIPILDRLHLTFPTSNPERNMQQIGRIRRPHKYKKDAVVYDYYDWQNPTFNRQFNNRKRKYTSKGWKVEFK